ncbi:hypothetical protein BIV57_06970 [Mangrovactinospora gilvigrisea]|uniref:DUF2252 domain-containing protein n=1 Tax=Mangrovactinospora gilvigrisea TaxID=1428644 RepID=A0A1J7C9L5_9ACTN|nr:hypothetical protein BIV57_06970 [Mangrovactinospora gilvigrisea]
MDGFAPGWARPGEGGGADPAAVGRALRAHVPRSAHARLALARNGAHRHGRDPVRAVVESNAGRLPHLIPIRTGRMLASPFTFLRGTAGLMAADLAAATPATGVAAQLCGDAHAGNFGIYGDALGRLTIDINDFDETVPGPWEWDLKRLAVSLVLAGRVSGASEAECRDAARDTAAAYRETLRTLARLPAMDAWNAVADGELIGPVGAAAAHQLRDTVDRVAEKARRNTSAKFAAKSSERGPDGRWRFVDAPPVLRRVPDDEAEAVASSLADYVPTVSADRRPLLGRFAVHDVAFRVVGCGSVGTRSYVVLLRDHLDEPLVLQVKEARPSALLPHLAEAGFPVPDAAEHGGHEGRRVVFGQKRMQVVSDILLGWTTVRGRPFQVRQFRNRKGSVDPGALPGHLLDDYGRLTGVLLARAHAHTADPRLLAGYCGRGEQLDEAIGAFATAYADVVEADHTELAKAVRDGRMPAETGV